MPLRLGSIDMLKGRIAEAIVEEMLKEAGFRVYRFGYESLIQNLTQISVELRATRVGRKISSMPDFVVFKEGYANFIEVKFRSGKPNHKSEDYNDLAEFWPESKILFVLKDETCFKIANVCDFVERGWLFPLEGDTHIKVAEDLVKKYVDQIMRSYGV